MVLRSRPGPYAPGRTPYRRSSDRIWAVGTFSLPTTSTVRMNRDRTLTASRAKASPMRKAYLLRKRARKSGSPRVPSTSTSQPTRWARPRSWGRLRR